METTVSYGYWIRQQRKALVLTQQALAERVGCSLAAIKKIDGDERRPGNKPWNFRPIFMPASTHPGKPSLCLPVKYQYERSSKSVLRLEQIYHA